MAHTTPAFRQTHFPIDAKDRPRYSKEQIQTYLKRVKLPPKYVDSPVFSDSSLARTKEHGLPLVQAMVRYHICNVPFENLEIHYSAHKKISLNMDDLYVKFGERGLKYGRGGRCMENSGFFGTVLRSLGYDVRNCAGRVSRMCNPDPEVRKTQGQTYDGWNHMLNLVRFDGQWWIVDVGMGAFGPNMPFPLEDGFECESIAPRRIRLQWRSIPEHAAEREEDAQKLWCFDVCFTPPEDGEEKVWIPTYCFTETEFLPQDYEIMSWYTSTHEKSFFTKVVITMKMLMDEEGEKIIGDITMAGPHIRKTIGGMLGGQKETLRDLKTEEDRILALKEIFGVELTEEEKQGIEPELRLQGA